MTRTGFMGEGAMEPRTLRMYRGSFWLGMVANAVFFLTLIMTRLLVDKGDVPAVMNQWAGLALTAAMVASALWARTAVTAMRDGDRDRAHRRLLTTALLGTAVFLGGVAVWGFTPLLATNLNVPSSLFVHYGPTAYPATVLRTQPLGIYGQIFFTLTGLVALEGLIGLGALWSTWLPTRFVNIRPDNYWGLEAAASFWVFIAVMWIAAYVVLYLV